MKRHVTCLSALAFFWMGCNDTAQTAKQGPLPKLDGKPAYAVQLAQWGSAAGVALLDETGAVLSKKYLSSGSASAHSGATLTQDITLPTTPCADDRLLILTRGGDDSVVEVEPQHGNVLAQIAAQSANKDTAFAADPQDILCFDGNLGLLSRAQHNPAPDAATLNRGDDLAVVDFGSQKITQRIDLSAYWAKGFIEDMKGNKIEKPTYARPGSIVPMGKHALVGLSRYGDTVGMQVPFNDQGLVLIADMDKLTVKSLPVPGLANCGELHPVADRDDAAIVSCSGAPYGEPSNTGLALISVSTAGVGKVEHKFQVKDGADPVYASVTSLGGTHVLAASQDWVNFTGDKAYLVDLATGKSSLLFSTKNAGDVGSGTWSPDSKLLLVPDATDGVRVFHGDATGLRKGATIAFDKALPARAVRSLIPR